MPEIVFPLIYAQGAPASEAVLMPADLSLAKMPVAQ
jgi:hypothetical protein